MEQEEEDRLSSLPKIILYDILSRLPEKDTTRTSVLSKTWLDTWNTFPILSFSITPSTENILRFCDYVKRRMLRFRDQSLAIKTFKLRVHLPGGNMSKDVDIWLKLACESGVEVIKFSAFGREQYYDLPMCVIEAKSLTKLVLFGSIKIEPIFVNHSIKFFSLRELLMTEVLLRDEQTIQHLISCCPLIEYIHLITCYVLSPSSGTIGLFEPINALSLSGLQKLKRVIVLGIQEVFIDAPSLEKLVYGPYNPSNAPFKIDFDRCKNLKELHVRFMKCTFFMDKWFLDLFPKFPFLESLELTGCKLCERINISSVRLKVLKLLGCYNFKEVNIDAPNLLSCQCKFYRTGALNPIISFLRNSSQLEVKIMMEFDFVDLCNLRKFVQNIKPHSVLTSLSLCINPPSMVSMN
jgi:hypothetical protein